MEEWKQRTEDDGGVDDSGTIIPGSQSEHEPETIYPATNVKIDRVQFSIFELKRRFGKGTICLDPEFQRNQVWTNRQKSELIESVIMGIPLPLIYMAETMEGSLVIVDGRQRLSSFFEYMDNSFALSNLKILPDLNGCKFEDLEKDEKKCKYATEIEDFQLVIQIIKYPTPDRIRFDIFDRVNRGGTQLNNQEMRNALYQGAATELLKALAGSATFKAATGSSVSPVRMKDRYIILRAISFCLWNRNELRKKNGELVKYRSDMEEFLGYAMEQLNWMQPVELKCLQNQFERIMNTAFSLLGENAFRIPGSKERRRPVSMTLFESMYYFFSLIVNSERDIRPEKILEATAEMLEDSAYLQALTYNVDSAVHVYERFQTVKNKFKELEDAEHGKDKRI